MQFKNLTPHEINLPRIRLSIAPSGIVARVTEVSKSAGCIPIPKQCAKDSGAFVHVEIITRSYGDVVDLPRAQKGIIYIVSAMVRMACPDRDDVLSPGDLIRDDVGQIIGCLNLVKNW